VGQFVLISHRKDLDGIASAALMVRYVTKHNPSPFYLTLRDYPDGAELIEEKLLGAKGFEFLIADLSTDQKDIEEVLRRIRLIRASGNRITWMDHHPTTDSIKSRLGELVDVLDLRESTTTGSQIVHERLYALNGIEDAHAEFLSSLGRDADLMELRYETTPKLVSLIDYYNYLDHESVFHPNLMQLALYLATPKEEADQEELLLEKHEEDISKYESMKQEGRKKILSDVEVIKSGRFRFAIFAYPSLFSGTQASAYVLEALDVDASVGFSEEGSGSVRRKNKEVNCREIAIQLGGGGHEFAAGFGLGFRVNTREELEKAKRTLKEAVVKVYGKG
jgi:oligoribonuclease NrnB/cAMP/cGMP phosphodiesterase (DHH superfamily)